MINIVSVIISELTKRAPLSLLIIVLVVALTIEWYRYDFLPVKTKIEDLPDRAQFEISIKNASVAHSFELLKFHLRSMSDEEIINRIDLWRQMQWGAQIASINNVCDNNPKMLESIMKKESVIYLCRK